MNLSHKLISIHLASREEPEKEKFGHAINKRFFSHTTSNALRLGACQASRFEACIGMEVDCGRPGYIIAILINRFLLERGLAIRDFYKK